MKDRMVNKINLFFNTIDETNIYYFFKFNK